MCVVLLNIAGVAFAKELTESDKITYLLNTVGNAHVMFQRNGKNYSATEAKDHLKMKLDKAGDRIKTADAFIDYIASKSSMTGEPYYIILADGKKVPSAEWLHAKLDGLEKTKKH
ncbi:MAG: hypothetical protein EB060_02445 [Proteobacteria bacterium]|nr:hypothetical protein [Pseudomonadota bacterium]